MSYVWDRFLRTGFVSPASQRRVPGFLIYRAVPVLLAVLSFLSWVQASDRWPATPSHEKIDEKQLNALFAERAFR